MSIPVTTPTPLPVEGGIRRIAVVLTDEQIKALPSQPIVLVAPTEILNYTDPITKLPLVIGVAIACDFVAPYTNVDAGAYVLVAIGSDWSADAGSSLPVPAIMGAGGHLTAWAGTNLQKPEVGFRGGDEVAIASVVSGSVQDNAIAFAGANGALGNFTGGDPANTMKVIVLYIPVDL